MGSPIERSRGLKSAKRRKLSRHFGPPLLLALADGVKVGDRSQCLGGLRT